MAVTLKFLGEDGRVQRFRWSDYPMVVTRIHPRVPPMRFRDFVVFDPGPTRFIQTMVECGPAAPYPAEPTADSYRTGVEIWLYR